MRFYDEISHALKEDAELVELFQSQLTEACYPDPELKTLTMGVGFYISRFYSQRTAEEGEEFLKDEADLSYEAYTKNDLLSEVYMDEKRYERLAAVLRNKRTSFCRERPA